MPTNPWLRLLGGALLLDFAAALAVAAYGWLNHWERLRQYGRGLVVASLALFVLGVLSSLGLIWATADPQYLYTRAVLCDGITERAERDRRELGARFGGLALLGLAALLLFILGMALDAIG